MRAALAIAVALSFVPMAQAWPWDGWSVDRVIDTGSADPAKAFEAFDAASLNLHDFDGDGAPEIVSFNDNNRLYVIDSDTGRIRAEIETTHPGGGSWPARDINPVSIGDLYGDGTPCLVVPNGAAYLGAWCYRGRTLAGAFEFEKTWEIRVDAAEYEKDFAAKHPWIKPDEKPGLDGNAFLANVDDDPGLEIFVETDGYPGQLSFEPDGSYRWSTSDWDGNAGAQVADLDGDGKKEAVFTSDAGVVACYDARSGKLEWTFDARKAGANPGSIPIAPLVADADGDGKLDVFFGARGAVEGPGDWRNASHATYFLLGPDGKEKWRARADWMNPLTYNRPAALDADGDGDVDIVTLDWNTVGHKPGNWEPTGRPSNLFALDGKTGALVWRQGLDVFWSNKDFVIADVAGDGALEIVADEAGADGRDGLGVRELRTGKLLEWHALPDGWEAMRGPVAAKDGREIILVVPLARADSGPNYRDLDVGHRQGALAVIGTGSTGAIAFSANFHHTDAPLASGSAPWWPKAAALAAAVVGGVALAGWVRQRRRA